MNLLFVWLSRLLWDSPIVSKNSPKLFFIRRPLTHLQTPSIHFTPIIAQTLVPFGLLFYKQPVCKKPVLEHPNHSETFSTQAKGTYNFFFDFLITFLMIQYLTLIKTYSEKNLPIVETLVLKRKSNLKMSLFVFNCQTVFYVRLLLYFKKIVKKLFRNFE